MKISVCMATYNGEKFIEEQLKSILKQLSSNDEVIISDDGSTDRTCSIVEALKDDRIHVVYNKGTHGFSHNFENALKYAKGDYIFLSDQDDVWYDNKISETVKVLEQYDFAVSDCITVDRNLKQIKGSRYEEFSIKGGIVEHFIKSRYLGCCMAFNQNVLKAVVPFPKNDFLIEHDIWIAAVSFLYFKYTLIKEPLIMYRRHGNNVSSGGFTEGYSIPVKLKKRVYRLLQLIKIYPKIRTIKRSAKLVN